MLPSLSRRPFPSLQRRYNATSAREPKSRHAAFYTDTLPAMAPVFLLGSAIYLGLRLAQMKLSHEKYLVGAEERINALEAEISALEANHKNQEQAEVPTVTSQPTLPQKQSSWSLW